MIKNKTILDLDNIRAKDFFLEEKNYFTHDLPKYITFQSVLTYIANKYKNPITDELLKGSKKCEKVNHDIYINKDSKYDWRKIELINPLLYVSMVNLITEKNNWETIKEKFSQYQKIKNIKCQSIPVCSNKERSQKSNQIVKWLNAIEAESMRLALDFEYLYQTDISNCYGSIYTHSLSWALHGKSYAKENRNNRALLGNLIDNHLMAMSYGQTIGIPQGSVLMDFVAEILLSYADNEFYECMKSEGDILEEDYHILRYRDDYRIFVREPSKGEKIIKVLSETLANLGLHLNTSKTKKNEDIIINSIKPLKLKFIRNPLPWIKNKHSLINSLILIYMAGKEFSNQGEIKKQLTNLYDKFENDYYYKGDERLLISILVNIAIDNTEAFHIIVAFISKIITTLNNKDKEYEIKKILDKLRLVPNHASFEIWIQRVTYPNNIEYNFKEGLCKNVSGVKNIVELFNVSWIKNKTIEDLISKSSYVNYKELNNLNPVVSSEEIALFSSTYEYL